MTTLKAAVVPAKVLKNGKHRIRIAIGHKQETRYIVTRFEIDNTANFKGGQVVGVPDAAHVNAKLRGILNSYQGSPDKPGGLSIQLCKSEKKEFYIRYSS